MNNFKQLLEELLAEDSIFLKTNAGERAKYVTSLGLRGKYGAVQQYKDSRKKGSGRVASAAKATFVGGKVAKDHMKKDYDKEKKRQASRKSKGIVKSYRKKVK